MKYFFIPVSDRFIFPCLNLIGSIRKYNKDCYIFLGDLGLSEQSVDTIRRIKNTSILEMEVQFLNMIHETNWPKEYMMKYILPWKLSNKIDRVLCLGADMLVQGDLSSLFDIDFKDNAFAAAVEMAGNICDYRNELYAELPADRLYVNAEMIMINCNYFREKYTAIKLLEEFASIQDRLLYYDQDFINICFYNKIIPLSPAYNCQLRELNTRNEMRDGLCHAKIIHYSANPKPWNWKCRPNWVLDYYKRSCRIAKRKIRKTFLASCVLYYPYKVVDKSTKMVRKVMKR